MDNKIEISHEIKTKNWEAFYDYYCKAGYIDKTKAHLKKNQRYVFAGLMNNQKEILSVFQDFLNDMDINVPITDIASKKLELSEIQLDTSLNAKSKNDLLKLSLFNKVTLSALLNYLYKVDDRYKQSDNDRHFFMSINSLEDFSFTPSNIFNIDVLSPLINNNILNFRFSYHNLELIDFYEKKFTYSSNCEFILNLKKEDLKSFDYITLIKELETVYVDIDENGQLINEDKILNEVLLIWKRIAYYELYEYTEYLFYKYKFNIDYMNESLLEKLKLILEDFSVSQGYAILYNSISSSASYKQTGISLNQAINSINTNIVNGIAKRKSGEWETKGYGRNFDMPESSISTIFFNNILKIGAQGFNQVPKLENIPKNFYNIRVKQDTKEDKKEDKKIGDFCNEIKEVFNKYDFSIEKGLSILNNLNKE